MTIAIETSPTHVTGSTPRSTASFTAPDGSLLVVGLIAYRNSGSAASLSVTGGDLVWTERAAISAFSNEGRAAIWTAPNPTSQSMQVTVPSLSGLSVGFKAWVVSGADLGTPAGQTGTGTSTAKNATVNGYTSSADGSRGFAAALDTSDVDPVYSSTDDEFAFSSSVFGMAVAKAANTGSSGTNVTFNFNMGSGAGTGGWAWAACEILPASDAPIRTRLVATMPAAVQRASLW